MFYFVQHTKLEKINQILAHYDEKILDNNVVDIDEYKMRKEMIDYV